LNLGWACNCAGDILDFATLALSLAARSRPTTVFTFHSIARAPYASILSTDNSLLGPDVFSRFIEWLASRANVIATEEIAPSGGGPSARKPVAALTFDDGFLDHYTTVYPLLRSHGLTGCFFIPTGLIGRAGGVSRSMVREMSDGGMTIGSHSVSHSKLSQLGSAEILHELTASKHYLEDLTGRACSQLAYPYGNYNEAARQTAMQAGYERAFASTPSTSLSDTFAMPRVSIPYTRSTWRYAGVLHDAGRWRRALGRSEKLDRFVHASLGYNSERLGWPRSMR
jgi:peptidoglycan/xylan/chitin deacetylase (PgdA/CDA1 family)